MCHFEFNSDKVPTAISETGYRSHFVNLEAVNFYETIEKAVDELVKVIIKENPKKKKVEKAVTLINENENKKVKMIIDYSYGFAKGSDYYLKEPVEDFVVKFENYGCLSSVGENAGTPEEIIKKYTEDMLKEGYKKENIEVVTSSRTEEKLIEMKKMISERRAYYEKEEKARFKKNGEQEIKEYSEKLKNLLKIKYGCDVTIRVLKNDVVQK